jgi:hypothetical protein
MKVFMKIKLFLFLLFSLCNTFSKASSNVSEDTSRKRKLSQAFFDVSDVSPLKREIFVYFPWLKTNDEIEDVLKKINPSEQSEVLRLTARHFESYFYCPSDEDNIEIHSKYVACYMRQYEKKNSEIVESWSREEAFSVVPLFTRHMDESLTFAFQDGKGIFDFITCLSHIHDPNLRSTLLTDPLSNFFERGPFWGAHVNYITQMVENFLREGSAREGSARD